MTGRDCSGQLSWQLRPPVSDGDWVRREVGNCRTAVQGRRVEAELVRRSARFAYQGAFPQRLACCKQHALTPFNGHTTVVWGACTRPGLGW